MYSTLQEKYGLTRGVLRGVWSVRYPRPILMVNPQRSQICADPSEFKTGFETTRELPRFPNLLKLLKVIKCWNCYEKKFLSNINKLGSRFSNLLK